MFTCTLCSGVKLKNIKSNFDKIFFECQSCGLIFTDPSTRPNPVLEIERYNLHKNDPKDANYRRFLSKVITPLLTRISKGMIGVDYGCGPGPAISEMLSEYGITVINYDPYFAAIQLEESNQYDFIISTEAIEHFYDPKNEFLRFSKLVRPAGFIAIMTEVFDGEMQFDSWWYAKEPTHVSLYQPRTFDWIAHKFNWQMVVPDKNVRIYQT